MPQKTLDYRRPVREVPALPWYKSDLAVSGITAAIILAVNAWLVWTADKSWGAFVWVFIFIPIANGLLAGVLLACAPIVRIVSGISASLHVWVTLLGCAGAIFVDAVIIFSQAHGC